MAEAQFPPPAKVPFSVRAQELEATRFLAIRKAASELYTNPDKTPLMAYGETLTDRVNVKKKVLEYELSNGWLIDDRTGGQVVQSVTSPTTAPSVPSTPAIGFVSPTAPPTQPPVPVVVFNAPQAVPEAPPPTQAAPMPQPPPLENSMTMPAGKARRGRPASLGTAVAPPPPPPQAVVLTAPATPQIPVQPVLQTVTAPTPMVPQIPMIPTTPSSPNQSSDLSAIMSKLEEIKKGPDNTDFKQLVANLSGQINETNKNLKELADGVKALKELAEASFVVLHHLYLTSPWGAQIGEAGKNAQTFREHLKQYIPR